MCVSAVCYMRGDCRCAGRTYRTERRTYIGYTRTCVHDEMLLLRWCMFNIIIITESIIMGSFSEYSPLVEIDIIYDECAV